MCGTPVVIAADSSKFIVKQRMFYDKLFQIPENKGFSEYLVYL